MDWKKYLPEGPFFLVGLIGFVITANVLIQLDLGTFLAYHLFIALGAYTAYRLYKKLKAPSTPA